MRGNDQKYVPDPRSRSPGLSQFPNMLQDFGGSSTSYATGERMSYIPPDYGRMNSGGMQYGHSTGYTHTGYERDAKPPTQYKAPAPQQYPMPDFRPTFDSSSVFVPQSKYLQEEMKKNTFSKDFNYATPSAPKPMSMTPSFGGIAMPQPQPYEMKPELPK